MNLYKFRISITTFSQLWCILYSETHVSCLLCCEQNLTGDQQDNDMKKLKPSTYKWRLVIAYDGTRFSGLIHFWFYNSQFFFSFFMGMENWFYDIDMLA